MRMLINVRIPHETFNAAVRDGTIGDKLGRILGEMKPEATYFTEQHGRRGLVLIVDIPDPSAIPALCEPWFLVFNAEVEPRIVISPEELQKSGLEEIAKKWA